MRIAGMLAANQSVTDARPAALGSGTGSGFGSGITSTGNSWGPDGTWRDSSVVSTNTDANTGPRSSDGTLPPARDLLAPRNGAAAGARF
ncbi:hypothetical protein [Streptomyces sp. NPDC050988]|uniref:hypothetical protein n=1 Tax=Streptomyces sp. NPDC050988 TaxID=3365637 RepID=UPI0037886A3C